MLRLPWDYESLLGVAPDAQPVADAVRASAGIPFFFRPFHMRANPDVTQGHGEILCTDGGMLSNFPVGVFDRTDGNPARRPTFGVKLSARLLPTQGTWDPDADAIQLAKSLLATMQKAHDQIYVDQPSVASRTIFVDTTGTTRPISTSPERTSRSCSTAGLRPATNSSGNGTGPNGSGATTQPWRRQPSCMVIVRALTQGQQANGCQS